MVHREFAINYYNMFQEYKGSTDVAAAAKDSQRGQAKEDPAAAKARLAAHQAQTATKGPDGQIQLTDAMKQQRSQAQLDQARKMQQ